MLDSWLKYREVFVFNMDECEMCGYFTVDSWEQIGNTRVHQPNVCCSDSLVEMPTYPKSMEANMNAAVTGDADYWSLLPCWEPTEYPWDLLYEEPDSQEKNEKILREVIANRARASAKLREVDPAIGWRDWEALCDSHCLPSAFDGVDMLALGKEAFTREVPFLNRALLDKYRVKAPRE